MATRNPVKVVMYSDGPQAAEQYVITTTINCANKDFASCIVKINNDLAGGDSSCCGRAMGTQVNASHTRVTAPASPFRRRPFARALWTRRTHTTNEYQEEWSNDNGCQNVCRRDLPFSTRRPLIGDHFGRHCSKDCVNTYTMSGQRECVREPNRLKIHFIILFNMSKLWVFFYRRRESHFDYDASRKATAPVMNYWTNIIVYQSINRYIKHSNWIWVIYLCEETVHGLARRSKHD